MDPLKHGEKKLCKKKQYRVKTYRTWWKKSNIFISILEKNDKIMRQREKRGVGREGEEGVMMQR